MRLIAVGVEDRSEHDHEILERGRSLAMARSRQHQQSFLAVHLSGVDVAEREDDQLAATPRSGRCDRRLRQC